MNDDDCYRVSVRSEKINIHGSIPINEAIGLLSYFESQGWTSLEENYDDSTITLNKIDYEGIEKRRIILESIEDNNLYKDLYENSKNLLEDKDVKINQLESLIKKLTEDLIIENNKKNELKNELEKEKSEKKIRNALGDGIHVSS